MKKHLKYCWLRVGLWMVDTCHWLGAFFMVAFCTVLIVQ